MSNDDSILTDIVRLIPGYGAYRDEESRRKDDRLTREFLVKRLGDCKSRLDRLALAAVQQVDLETPAKLEKLRTEVDLASTRLAAAVEGYAGWFSDRKVDAALLKKVVELDQDLVSLVDQIDSELASGQSDIKGVDAQRVQELLERLFGRIDRRSEMLQGE